MVINWKQARVKIIPLVDPDKKDVQVSKRVILLPGMNHVDNEDWDICKKILTKYDMTNMEVITENVIVVEEVKKDGKTSKKEVKKETSEFKEFSFELAEKAIDDCFDLKTLNKWKKDESRSDVRALILEKIDKIKNRKNDLTIDKREE